MLRLRVLRSSRWYAEPLWKLLVYANEDVDRALAYTSISIFHFQMHQQRRPFLSSSMVAVRPWGSQQSNLQSSLAPQSLLLRHPVIQIMSSLWVPIMSSTTSPRLSSTTSSDYQAVPFSTSSTPIPTPPAP